MPTRALSVDLAAAIADGKPSLQVFLKVTCSDSTVLGFTGLDVAVVYSGVTYQPGLTVTQIESGLGLSVDNLETSGFYREDIITELDAAAGKYDAARYELFVLDYEDLAAGAMILQRGLVREIRSADNLFTVNLASLSQLVGANVGHLTSANCQVKQVGDSQCGLNLEAGTHPTLSLAYKLNGTVATVTNRLTFTVTGVSHPTEFFNNGKLTWLTGVNAGVVSEVKTYTKSGTTGTFVLQEPPRKGAIVAGATFKVTWGCNRTYYRCGTVSNVVNMRRAFPWLPGQRKILVSA